MKNVWKSILHHIFVMAVIAGVLIAASIYAYRSAWPRELTCSEDGYYEIYTACDYEQFWDMVSRNQTFVKGRLMNDIYLNDLSDYEEWENTPPAWQSKDILMFTGNFDGNGHTIFGLYSQNGYGLVRKNIGTIHDLFIEDSLIIGSDKIGGICLTNTKTIRNCEFGGKIKSDLEEPYAWAKMAGICVDNSGIIERCGYTGSMIVSCDWSENGVMAGICTTNEEEIVNCYNLSQDDFSKGEEFFYAIADRGEENCFIGENLKESACFSEHTMLINEQQAVYLSAFLDRDLYAVYEGENNRQIFLRPPVNEQDALIIEELSALLDPAKEHIRFPADEITNTVDGWTIYGPQKADEEEMLSRAFQDEKISGLIWEILAYQGADWGNVSLTVSGETENAWFAVELSDGTKNLKLAAYLFDEEVGERTVTNAVMLGEPAYCNKIWAYCSDILGQKDGESWEHATWGITSSDNGREMEGIVVLYQTAEERKGFFYIKGGMIYQVEGEAAAGEDAFFRLKEQIRNPEEETEKEQKEERSGIEENNKLWEHIFWEICENSFFTDAFIWRDDVVRRAVYNEFGGYEEIKLSTEELSGLEYLQIDGADQVKSFQDLAMFPELTTLYLRGGEGTIKFDLTQKMVPNLKELYIMRGNLTDISFLKEFSKLEDISFYMNEIQDISPLTYCKELKVLSLGYNKVEDITPLAELSGLEEVGLQGNEIKDIEALRFLPELKGVNLNDNQITDLSPLAGMIQLEALGASFNQISDISPLKGMNQMYNLALDMNQITDISALEEMTQMEYLGLAYNLIEDYAPLEGMKKLFSLSVTGNPGQDIGDLIFVPVLNMGRNGINTEEELKKAQEYLDQYYPGQGIAAEDIAWGDLNGDGREDLAITGLTGRTQEDYWSGSRMVYPFLKQTDGRLKPLEEIETLDPDCGGIYGDPYQGIIITDQKLVIQVYGGSNWRWGYTKIYEYENGHMEEKWELDLEHFVMTEGLDWSVYDEEKNVCCYYVVVGDMERKKNILLVNVRENANGESQGMAWEELNEKVEEIGENIGRTLPKVDASDLRPEIGGGYYEYQVYETLLATERKPDQVLKMAAEKFLTQSVELPVFIYSYDEIRNSYIKLTGLEVPKEFYLGFEQGEPKLLVYIGCEQNEAGAFVHKLRLEGVDEKYWTGEKVIYFDESTGTFTIV